MKLAHELRLNGIPDHWSTLVKVKDQQIEVELPDINQVIRPGIFDGESKTFGGCVLMYKKRWIPDIKRDKVYGPCPDNKVLNLNWHFEYDTRQIVKWRKTSTYYPVKMDFVYVWKVFKSGLKAWIPQPILNRYYEEQH